MKERLIELLDKKQVCGWKYVVDDYTTDIFNEDIADYLLDNGVIALPCAVGDTVYVLEPCACYNNYGEYEHCHHRRTKATKWLKMARLPSKHHTRCMKLFIRPFKLEYINKLGKTVFLSREEAEKALERSEGK